MYVELIAGSKKSMFVGYWMGYKTDQLGFTSPTFNENFGQLRVSGNAGCECTLNLGSSITSVFNSL